MSVIWSEIIEPQTLTSFIRSAVDERERSKGSLTDWLPPVLVDDIAIQFYEDTTGFRPVASFRAWDAEPGFLPGRTGRRVTLNLPPIGGQHHLSEFDRLRARNAGNDQIQRAVLQQTYDIAAMISDRLEQMRGEVLFTGRAVIPELLVDDNFGRDPRLTVASAWADPSASRLDDLQEWSDIYEDINGVPPETMLMTRSTYRLLCNGDEFRPQLLNGVSRPATPADAEAVIVAHGLPTATVYNRRVAGRRNLPDNAIIFLPAAGSSTDLGATYYGQSLGAGDPSFGLEPTEMPGIIAALQRGTSVPFNATIVADGIAMPVLSNANLSMVATVGPVPVAASAVTAEVAASAAEVPAKGAGKTVK